MAQFDLVIIGGGVAGLVTASGAAQFGAKVASLIKRSEEFGIEKSGAQVNFQKVMNRVRSVQERIGRNDDPERFRSMGVELFFGEGKASRRFWGGFREDVPLEDIDFYRRLRQGACPVIIKDAVVTSARRFSQVGRLKQEFINLFLVSLYDAGFNIFRVKERLYPEVR